jgi:DNA-binding NarL/FixJ family response regulator
MVKIMKSSTRVIIADDRPEVRSALRLLIENGDENLQVVAEAAEFPGLEACLCQNQVDIILLDWELPGFTHTGETCAVLLDQLRSKHHPAAIIAISGLYEARNDAQAAGVDAFISKIDPPDYILSLLRSIPIQNP